MTGFNGPELLRDLMYERNSHWKATKWAADRRLLESYARRLGLPRMKVRVK